MTSAAVPFTLKAYDLDRLPDGRAVALAPMTVEAALTLGEACAAMDPWRRYGISAARLTDAFAAQEGPGFRFEVRVDDATAGVLMVMSPWLIGPYLQFIAVLPPWQGASVGRALLTWFEARARLAGQRNIWLCVTAFNDVALAFYRSLGWEVAATLPGLVADDIDEIMMRKRLV